MLALRHFFSDQFGDGCPRKHVANMSVGGEQGFGGGDTAVGGGQTGGDQFTGDTGYAAGQGQGQDATDTQTNLDAGADTNYGVSYV